MCSLPSVDKADDNPLFLSGTSDPVIVQNYASASHNRTSADEILGPARRQTLSYTSNLSGDLQQFFLRRASLSVVDSCLMFAGCVVISSLLRPPVLRQFHAAHPSTCRVKSTDSSFAYGLGIDSHIDDLIRRCSRCQQAAKMPPRQPSIPWQPSWRAWSRSAGSLTEVSCLILADAYSKWPYISPQNLETAPATIAFLRRIFNSAVFTSTIWWCLGDQQTLDKNASVVTRWCQLRVVVHAIALDVLGRARRQHPSRFNENDAAISSQLAEENTLGRAYIDRASDTNKAAFYQSRRLAQQRLQEIQDTLSARKAKEIRGSADRNESKDFFAAIEALYDQQNVGATLLLNTDGSTLLTKKS
ncbi:hypothetical protein SprV_0501878400 [Sparganum proliferum]